MVPSSTPVPSVCQNNRRGRRASCQREGAWWHLVKLAVFYSLISWSGKAIGGELTRCFLVLQSQHAVAFQ